ncbi:hypothetical protein SAMN05444156_1224 [Verrucomicrobium sp. GAS474]|uniref:metallophosphoesterase n=1 Tax=Verrucomicrobium sp. GAS474 TaxID=1882831 RepID=UPI00087C23DD|nr:metallophosphoesterase [Verrucomicrobium sp. GAS474]SDT98012.1 hypothetical protein SAMN05444156_1224 [Verrucomicrobium sp. GAS474]
MPTSARPSHPSRSGPVLLIFLGVFTLILTVGVVTAVSAWERFGWGGTAGLWALLLPSYLFVPALLFSRERRRPEEENLLRYAYRLSAVSLALLSYLFLAGALTWIGGEAAVLLDAPETACNLADLLFGLGLAATLYGMANALLGLRVTRRDVFLRNLPASWHGRTVALVTDLHLGHIYGVRFSRRVVAKLRALSPDLVLIGGDLFDGVARDFEPILAPWKPPALAPPFGVHYVTGNHEEFGEREIFLSFVRHAGINILNGTEKNHGKVELDGLQLLGLHDREATTPESLRTFLHHAGIDRERAALLLAHIPHRANFPVADEEGISLQLSGHTHNGQVWPWKGLARRVHGAFVYGLHPFGKNLQVCTSSGAGSWGPPMRVGTRSEIVLLRLFRA